MLFTGPAVHSPFPVLVAVDSTGGGMRYGRLAKPGQTAKAGYTGAVGPDQRV